MTHPFQVGLGAALALMLAVGCRGPFAGKAGRSLCEGTMTVTSKVEGEVVEFQANNACALPQLLSFEILRPVNLDVDRAGSRLRVIPPASTRSLATARRKDSSKQMEYSLRYSSWGGDPDARPDRSVAYAVPFGGSQSCRLGQGPHGVFSHKQKFAYDFGVPEGTPVLAARDGVIYYVRERFSTGSSAPRMALGCSPMSNTYRSASRSKSRENAPNTRRKYRPMISTYGMKITTGCKYFQYAAGDHRLRNAMTSTMP